MRLFWLFCLTGILMVVHSISMLMTILAYSIIVSVVNNVQVIRWFMYIMVFCE